MLIASCSDWRWSNFSPEEMQCQETGELGITVGYMNWIQGVRTECGFPLVVISGYRSPEHSIEIVKDDPENGEHPEGMCSDIVIPNWRCMDFMRIIFKHGVRRLGIRGVKDGSRVFHVGMSTRLPQALWTY